MTTEDTPDPRVMEAYVLAVEMADRVSARRGIANAFFLTLNTTLVAVLGLRSDQRELALPFIAFCVVGIIVAACWWFLLQNYRRLNVAKFVVINQIEEAHLPVHVFKDEWDVLGIDDPQSGRSTRIKAGFKQLGGVERIVLIVFGLLYVVLLVGRLVS
ncbi:RipA family octameric membrane protein [Clavibacter michiganensis]|uniref:RipA family octameric membrane protein n=1 Tax=Clavibacter michiganensis TaxID=28447 RepID=UPI00292E98FE|nr:hypothetical protein [Clavibacter michiganensis]